MAEDVKNPEETKERKAKDDHVVFVGSKPFMNYVTGVVTAATG